MRWNQGVRRTLKKIIWLLCCCCFICSASPKVEAFDAEYVVYAEVAANNGNAVQAEWISQAILYASSLYQVDPLLVTAVMEQESGFNLDSYSSAGAIGLMQLMPDTAASIGVDPYEPLQNVVGGVAHLRTLLDSFTSWGEYGVTDAIAGYNAGGNAVLESGGVPQYRETIAYVRSIDSIYRRLLSYTDY